MITNKVVQLRIHYSFEPSLAPIFQVWATQAAFQLLELAGYRTVP